VNRKRGIGLKISLKISFAVLIILGCLLQSSVLVQAFEVMDSKGNTLRFDRPPERIVSLIPTATEILFEIGAKGQVTGLTYHDATLEGAQGKEVVGGFFRPAVERIEQLKPDMLILGSMHEHIIDKFKDTGCQIFVYDTRTIEHSYQNILTLGKIVDREKEAQAVVEKNKHQVDHIKLKLSKAVPDKHKRVIRLMGRDAVMTPGNTSFQNELIRNAGGIPPDFGKKGSVVPVTVEEWTTFNPEVIYGCGGDKEAAEAFFSRPGWKDVDAVKQNQIYYFDCELTCRAATHSGYFVSWLSSMIYRDEFADSKNDILPVKTTRIRPVKIDLPYVKSASIHYADIYDFENKTLVIDFIKDQTIVSTLEGQKDHILTVGNHYSPPPTWGPGHKMGIDHIRASILKAVGKEEKTTSFLMTGADMDNLSVSEKTFKEMKVVAIVTAGVMSNAIRSSKDAGMFYEPGTINVIILTNMQLSNRAMTRAIIAGTEAKTAALEDMDSRSSYTPLLNEATGTGTDNILVVKGEGVPIKNSGGHSKMGELVAKAVYDGVKEAVFKQNHIVTGRHIFQRLQERKISIFGLTSGVACDCMNIKAIPTTEFTSAVEHLLLDSRYASFLESALALSDEYEKGLINDMTLFEDWCLAVAGDIAGVRISHIRELVTDENIPIVIQSALNAIFTGTLEKLNHENQ